MMDQAAQVVRWYHDNYDFDPHSIVTAEWLFSISKLSTHAIVNTSLSNSSHTSVHRLACACWVTNLSCVSNELVHPSLLSILRVCVILNKLLLRQQECCVLVLAA